MFGSHLSIAGGLHLAVEHAGRLGLDCVQVFTKNQQQWKAPPLTAATITAWRTALAQAGWSPGEGGVQRTVSHASYLINLASPEPGLAAQSLALMGEEIDRCEALGIGLLVFHPGAFTTGTVEGGVRAIAEALAGLLRARLAGRTVLCLEDVVGAGTTIGARFEQLAEVRALAMSLGAPAERLGFCIDSCHAHSAGYDCASRASAQATIQRALSVLGAGTIRCLHLNDSMTAMGSKRDRHQHIGEGSIGLDGFAAFVNHPAFRDVPKIMETPKGARAKVPGAEVPGADRPSAGVPASELETDFDLVNVGRLRALMDVGTARAALPVTLPMVEGGAGGGGGSGGAEGGGAGESDGAGGSGGAGGPKMVARALPRKKVIPKAKVAEGQGKK